MIDRMTQPSPRYCLRQSPSGRWWIIPVAYEYGFTEWCKHHPGEMPPYAKEVDLATLTFEVPR